MNVKKLAVFFTSTFMVTWACWGGLVYLVDRNILNNTQGLFMVLFVSGALGPTVSSYISFYITDLLGLKDFHQLLFKWRLNILWYLVAFLLPFGIIALVSAGIYNLVSPGAVIAQTIKPWYMIVPFLIMTVFGGGLEEFGWRGVALPELEKRFNPLVSSLILGVIWTVWHLPLFFLKGFNQYGHNFWVFSLGVLGLALILTWLYNHTKSILMCIIFHASFDMTASMGYRAILVSSVEILRGMITALLLIGVGLILLIRWPRS